MSSTKCSSSVGDGSNSGIGWRYKPRACGIVEDLRSAGAFQSKTGERIPDDPVEVIDEQRQQQPCSLMVVEVDGTTSPHITELEGITGRDRLRAATCYKEVQLGGDREALWRERGGPVGLVRATDDAGSFVEYAEQAGLRMGFLQARETVFLADGARHNWDMQETHFPGSVPILDYYHAAEHLADYCDLQPAAFRAGRQRR